MTGIALKGLWAHKRRLTGSFVAVLLGVSFLFGTLVLSSTLSTSIDRFFTQATAGTDVSVRDAAKISDGPNALRGPIDGSAADRVRRVPGVAAAEPVVQAVGQVLGRDGKTINAMGQRYVGNWITDETLNPYRIAAGHAPSAPGEIALNRGSAKLGHLRVGDTTYVLFARQKIRVRLVGITTFGGQDGFGGVSFAAFTAADAQRFVPRGTISTVAVRAAHGVSQDALAERIRPVLPANAEAITGRALDDENLKIVGNFEVIFKAFLYVFAGIALLVGALSIYNTFSIIVAQRTRESALLRAVGASRRQVLGSILTEAAAVGVVGSVAGLGGGLGLARLLGTAFASMGASLPVGGLIVTVTSVIVSLVVGVLVTLLACFVPALRASKVPPVAALREAAAEPAATSRGRLVTGAVLAVGGIGTVAVSAIANASTAIAGGGAVATLAGMVVLGPVAARPACSVLGAPLRGLTGTLARRDAARNPRRTAGAAAALMVGVGVVTLFTVLAASISTSVRDKVSASFGGDLVVDAGSNETAGFSPRLAADVGALPEVAAAAGAGSADVRIGGKAVQARVADPASLGRVLKIGDAARLGAGRFAVTRSVADARHWRIGTPVEVRFTEGGPRTLTVGAIMKNGDAVGDYLVNRAGLPEQQDTTVFVKLKGGVSPSSGKRVVTAAARPYGSPTVQDRAAYADASAARVQTMLSVIYVMLALAIVIALLGIANTMSLSIHERTRELGLLRAVGATRGQLRAMVRWESLLVALFGTTGGAALGLYLGWAIARSPADGAFTAPITQLITIIVGGALAGLLAGLRPARRAARLPILAAVTAP